MRQLTGLDSLFLELETRACPMHVGSLLILDPHASRRTLDFSAVVRHIEQHLHRVPAFRRRIISPPLNLDFPYWIEDPDFDIEHHVLHRALPGPGNAEQLGTLIADVMSRPLHRDRPLWQFYFISGLARGRAALICKMHHACIDGVSGADLLSVLLDPHPDAEIAPPKRPWSPEPLPSPMQLSFKTAGTLLRQPLVTARLIGKTGSALFASHKSHAAGTSAASRTALPHVAPRTRFNTMITARRSYAYGSLSLARIRKIRKAAGVSVNDVVLCISAAAVRRYLLEKDELPQESLWAGVPISVRQDDERGSFGNRVMMARASLHTEIAKPMERLRAISEKMHEVKHQHDVVPARLLLDWLDVPAPAVFIQAARLFENFAMQDLTRIAFNLVISNIPGSRKPLYFAGARLLHNHPISIPYHGLAFNITVMSYRDRMDYGLTAHRESMSDIEHFARMFEAALDELEDACTGTP